MRWRANKCATSSTQRGPTKNHQLSANRGISTASGCGFFRQVGAAASVVYYPLGVILLLFLLSRVEENHYLKVRLFLRVNFTGSTSVDIRFRLSDYRLFAIK